MDFITSVKDIYSRMGATRTFFAVLCDYGAFDNEEPWMRNITKSICDEGFPYEMTCLRQKGQWTTKVADMIYKLSSRFGYQADMASAALHKMALGLGLVDTTFNWDGEFGTKTAKNSTVMTTHSSKPNNCPDCGRPYYKTYSTHCAFCGRKR